jgi:hypothetical protein
VKPDWIGWIATALFACSYLFKQPAALRKVQAGAALLWVIYGLIIHAMPVVVANVVVAGVAGCTVFRGAGTSGLRIRSGRACRVSPCEHDTLRESRRKPLDTQEQPRRGF